MLRNPDAAIISKGGQIFFAIDGTEPSAPPRRFASRPRCSSLRRWPYAPHITGAGSASGSVTR